MPLGCGGGHRGAAGLGAAVRRARPALPRGLTADTPWLNATLGVAMLLGGSTFLDRLIALVEGAARQKTPNEIAFGIGSDRRRCRIETGSGKSDIEPTPPGVP